MVLTITPGYFPFVLGKKSLLPSFITNLAEMGLLLTKWVADLESSMVRKAAIPSSR